jgi:drug/metabolite transporter (DMT)-like permease
MIFYYDITRGAVDGCLVKHAFYFVCLSSVSELLTQKCWLLYTLCCSIQVLPLHDAIVLNFTTPFMAAILASFILQEKLGVIELGGMILLHHRGNQS